MLYELEVVETQLYKEVHIVQLYSVYAHTRILTIC